MIEVINNLAGLGRLAREWNRLPGALQSPLLRHEWFMSCAEAFHRESDLHVIILHTEGRLRAAAPLARVNRHGTRRLALLGASTLHEPSGLLYDSADSLAEMCAVLTRQPYPVVLQRLPAESSAVSQMRTQSGRRGTFIARPAAGSPYLSIHSSWEQYHGTLSSRRRYDFRRARGRLGQRGTVSVRFISPSADDMAHLLDGAFRIESSGWKGRLGSGLQCNHPLQHFMRVYAGRICPTGMLRITLLEVADEAVAMQIGVIHANRYWLLKIGHDERWADYSPGMQLMMETVRMAFEQELEAYEFLGADEPWLRVWTNQSHATCTLVHYPYSTYGFTALGLDGVAHLARRFLRNH
jgi:CelD/BcsL family acetyltransferase involved in cellulose biosynthesis